MLSLKKLHLSDFLSHADTAISFDENSRILIDGPSGVGKSSILEGIIWALYGTGRSDNKSLVRKGTKKATVTLTVNDGKSDFILTRSISLQSGKHTLSVQKSEDGSDPKAIEFSGLRELQGWIEGTLVGASYTLFVNSVAYVQGNADSFVGQNAQKRKDLLLELVKADDYDSYYEKAKDKLNEAKNEENLISGQVNEMTSAIARCEVDIAALELVSNDIDQKKHELELINNKRDTISRALKECDSIYESLSSAKRELRSLGDLRSSLVSSIELLNKKKETRASLVKDVNGLDQAIAFKANLDKSLELITAELDEAKEVEKNVADMLNRKPSVVDPSGAINGIKKRISLLQGKPVCPSGDECPYHGKDKEEISSLIASIDLMEEGYNKEKEKLSAWESEYEDLSKKRKSVSDIIVRMNECGKEIAKASARIGGIELAKISLENDFTTLDSDLLQTQSTLDGIPDREQEISASIDSLTKKLDTAATGINREELDSLNIVSEKLMEELFAMHGKKTLLAQKKKELSELSDRISIIKSTTLISLRETIEALEMVKDAFSSKGIKTVVIDYIIPRLEDSVNDVLSKLSDFRVRFDTQRESSSGDNTVEGMFITIVNDIGEEMSYENYSGGEKLKITVAIAEALASLQKVGFRLFDEVFIGLDDASTESFANVLSVLQSRFGQVLCISHLGVIKDMFDTVIPVHKAGGVSSID